MFAWPQDSEEETEMTKLSCSDYPKDGVAYICGQSIFSAVIFIHVLKN